MEVKTLKGSIAGLPISGRVVDYSGADITQIVAAASGLGRVLLTGGVVAAGAFALLAALSSATLESQKSLERNFKEPREKTTTYSDRIFDCSGINAATILSGHHSG